jgi:hypothetical protein
MGGRKVLRSCALVVAAVVVACTQTSVAPVAPPPAFVGTHPAGERISLEPLSSEGIEPGRLAAALEPVRQRLTRCLPGSGGKVEIRITRNSDGTLWLNVEPGVSLDPTAKDCVLETLSTVDLEQVGSNVGGTSLPPSGFTSLIQVSW